MSSRPRNAANRPTALEQCSASERGSPWLASLAALGAHGLLCALALGLGEPAPSLAAKAPAQLYEVEFTPPPEPAAPPPEPEPVAPEPKLKAPKSAPAAAPVPEPEPPPAAPEPEPPAPAAAQAAEAITAPEESPAPPTDTLVTGSAASFAGGTTERGGSSAQAVDAPNARALGVEGGTGNGAVDRSRQPGLASGLHWDCPFPEEAAEDGVERATVPLVVDVAADGKVLGIEIKRDPGYGFGREARSCALRKRWRPGADRSGQPQRAKLEVNVTFVTH